MRRCCAVVLFLLVAAVGLGVSATSAVAATGPDLRVGATLVAPPPQPDTQVVPLAAGTPVSVRLDLDDVGDVPSAASLRVHAAFFDPTSVSLTRTASGAAVACSRIDATDVACGIDELPAGELPEGSHDRTVTLAATVAADAPIGDAVALGVALTPTAGTDPNPDDNGAAFSFVVVGGSDVRATIDTAAVTVPAGAQARVTVSVSNAGPDASLGTRVGVLLQLDQVGGIDLAPVQAGDPAFTVTRDDRFVQIDWSVGLLPVGGTASTVFVVSGLTEGATGGIGVHATTTGTDPVPCYSAACVFDAAAPVSVTGAVASGPTGGTGSGTRPVLAVTGSDDVPLTVTGLGLLAAGGVLLVAARRRRHG